LKFWGSSRAKSVYSSLFLAKRRFQWWSPEWHCALD